MGFHCKNEGLKLTDYSVYFLLYDFLLILIVVFIHMDDQLDGKTLVGTYVCTDQPGEFRWQPGSLTQVSCMEF